MDESFLIKCEPGWPADTEEPSNVEPDRELPSVKAEDVKVEPPHAFVYPSTSVFIKEEQLIQDVKKESDHEDYDNDIPLQNQTLPLLLTTKKDETVITSYKSHQKETYSVGCNSDSSYYETDERNVVENEDGKRSCNCCSKPFRTELLERYALLKGNNGQTSPRTTAGESENLCSCDGCGKMFARRYLRECKERNFISCLQCNERLAFRHKELQKCQYCDKMFPDRTAVTRHELTHTGRKPYSCTQCGRAFSALCNLKRHQALHTGVKEYKCPSCEKKFTDRCNLKTHLYTHEGKTPYKCSTCEKYFITRWCLNRHTATHNREKPFGCSDCKKSFAYKADLVRHILTHNREKAFKCTYCSRAFAQNYSLKSHLLTHTGEKPHCCTMCNMSFRLRAALNKHMIIHAAQ